MKKIGFVISWYGDDIAGGAENMLRDLTTELHRKNIPVEILTTCAKEFRSDWNKNFYKEGVYFSRSNVSASENVIQVILIMSTINL